MQNALEQFTSQLRRVVPISESESASFFQLFQPVELSKGEYFVRDGEVCNRIGFLESGMIRYYYLDEESETTRWMGLEGEFVTSLGSFISGEPSNHYLQAIKPCKIWVIKKDAWWLQYAQHAVLRDFWVRVIEAMVIGYEIRVYQHLAQDAEQRYYYFMKYFPQFVAHVPQKYLASMMGIKPESLSRIRAKLSKRIS